MDFDAREQRLRAHFGAMMVSTALAVVVIGHVLGLAMAAVFSAADFAPGFALGDSRDAAGAIAGHVIAGVGVLVALLRSYLAPLHIDDGRAQARRSPDKRVIAR